MADNPQETIRELRELVVTYAKQETLDPLKGMGRFAAWGIAGALFMGIGLLFGEIGLLRLLQDETYPHFRGHLSYLPYLFVVIVSSAIVVLVIAARGKRKKKS